MTKPIPAIVETEHAAVEADVRACYSALREAEAQCEKAEKRAEAARAAVGLRRRELGLALIKARQAWPERGPKAKGWGQFLEREGITQSTAWRLMEEADPKISFKVNENSPPDVPHPAASGQPKLELVPSPRKPLGLLADMQLYVGRWEDVLSPDEIGVVDTLITDAPFSKRTHESKAERADGCEKAGLAPDYHYWTPEDVTAFVEHWSPRTRVWMVALCDHHLIPAWQTAYERMDRYAYAPVPCVIQGMSVRLAGDGPSSWAVYAMVSRPRSGKPWNALPGAYVGNRDPGSRGGRGKPRWLMDALVRDYSRPNDLVCDPLAGYGTTLVSALLQRRRAIGAEVDEDAVNEAFERVKAINEPLPEVVLEQADPDPEVVKAAIEESLEEVEPLVGVKLALGPEDQDNFGNQVIAGAVAAFNSGKGPPRMSLHKRNLAATKRLRIPLDEVIRRREEGTLQLGPEDEPEPAAQ